MKYLNNLTQEYIKSILRYFPDTGEWYWISKGYKAGSLSDKGYIIININGKKYRSSRLAWIYMTGEWPKVEIDHDNNIRSDDRWLNLREATGTENCYNYGARKDNKLNIKGVYIYKGRYRAQIQINKKKIFLGSFGSLEEAKKAHDDAANNYQGEFVHSTIVKNNSNV